MSDFIRKDICEGVAFNSIVDTRFKKSRISATLVAPLNKKTTAANALLSYVLTRSCRKYPDFTALNRKLDSLYGAALYPSVSTLGDMQVISFSAAGLDDRYSLDAESVSSELADLLCSIIFDPAITDGKFNTEDLEQERRQLIDAIDADFNDKRTYAINRCIECMCRNEPFSIGRYGSREDVSKLTQEDVYYAWQQLLANSKTELAMLGSADPQNAYDRFRTYFENKPRKMNASTIIIDKPEEIRHITETEEISQSKLVMGFRAASPDTKEKCVANSLMSAILGGTPTSKLFVNVREKQSLCYYCSSSLNISKGIMLIDSGVETKNIEKTEEAVLEQIRMLKNGCITDDELASAKLALKNAYLSSLDSLAALQLFYINGILRNMPMSPLEAASIVENITKEQVTEFAKKLQLDTVFSLIGN